MKIKLKGILSVLVTSLSVAAGPTRASAADATIAVAANFTAAANAITRAFEAETGHDLVLAFGSTGKLYAQIANGAPFAAFLAADQIRPEKAQTDGFAIVGTRFTYARGKIVLYSADAALVDGDGKVLGKPDTFAKIAIANPRTAPYGAAAIEAMTKLSVFDALKDKIVQGDSIAQTHQFVMTQNAGLGFVAYAQVIHTVEGSLWVVPEDLYVPIRQDAVLLKSGANNQAAIAFLEFLKSEPARAIIASFGYGLN